MGKKNASKVWGILAWVLFPLWVIFFLFYPNRNFDFVILNLIFPVAGMLVSHYYSKLSKAGKLLQYIYLVLLILVIIISAYLFAELMNPLYYKTQT